MTRQKVTNFTAWKIAESEFFQNAGGKFNVSQTWHFNLLLMYNSLAQYCTKKEFTTVYKMELKARMNEPNRT